MCCNFHVIKCYLLFISHLLGENTMPIHKIYSHSRNHHLIHIRYTFFFLFKFLFFFVISRKMVFDCGIFVRNSKCGCWFCHFIFFSHFLSRLSKISYNCWLVAFVKSLRFYIGYGVNEYKKESYFIN